MQYHKVGTEILAFLFEEIECLKYRKSLIQVISKSGKCNDSLLKNRIELVEQHFNS